MRIGDYADGHFSLRMAADAAGALQLGDAFSWKKLSSQAEFAADFAA